MVVLKSDGRAEPIYFDKITSRIEKLCYGLEAGYIDHWLGIHGENIDATIEIFGLLSQKLSPTLFNAALQALT